MFPTLYNYSEIMTLLANDTGSYNQATNKNNVTLVNSPFTPGLGTTYAGLTPATFTGSTPLTQNTGPATPFRDPVSGLQCMLLPSPVGGWTWVCTAAPTTPETIYGYVVSNHANTATYGSFLFPTPIVIANVGDGVTIPEIAIGLPVGVLQSFND